jgi:hypothetical protein
VEEKVGVAPESTSRCLSCCMCDLRLLIRSRSAYCAHPQQLPAVRGLPVNDLGRQEAVQPVVRDGTVGACEKVERIAPASTPGPVERGARAPRRGGSAKAHGSGTWWRRGWEWTAHPLPSPVRSPPVVVTLVRTRERRRLVKPQVLGRFERLRPCRRGVRCSA